MIFGLEIGLRGCGALLRNVTSPGRSSRAALVGFPVSITAIDESLTVLTISNVRFSWNGGQHVYIWTPHLPLHTPHPFTITDSPSPSQSNTLRLFVRTKRGFNRTLDQLARKRSPAGDRLPLRVLITRVSENLPQWHQHTAVVLISSSTGTSFTLSVIAFLVGREDIGELQSVCIENPA